MNISVPNSAIVADARVSAHMDGPLLTWAGHLHWLTFRERIAYGIGQESANSLAAKRFGRPLAEQSNG